MWHRAIVILLLVWMPHIGAAQTVTIRSGEHNDFTRLVVPIVRGDDWNVTQDGKIVTFGATGFSGTYNTADVFRLVPRGRVLAVVADAGELKITLGCDCKVAPFVTRDRYVVLDIAEQDVSLAAPVVKPNTMIEKPVVVEEPVIAKAKVVQRSFEVSLPLVPQRIGQPIGQRIVPLDLPSLARNPLSEAEQAALSEMQQRLVMELSTAATRGVLNPLPGRTLPDFASQEGANTEEVTEPQIPARRDVSRNAASSMRITSSIDLPLLMRQAQNSLSMRGLTCPTNESFSVATWGDERPFHEQIGEARRHLFGEFDKLDQKWATKLAKIYIFFGFGAEALQILSLEPELMLKEPYLGDLANIMENGIALENSDLRALLDCETDIALWAILAKVDLAVTHTVDPSAALLALNKLPVHLRKFLAPTLSQRLLSHGDTAAAAAALRNLERLPSSLPTAAKLAKANIEIDEGNLSDGAETLNDVVDDNAIQSPQALITLVETQLDANQPIDAETAGLIAAYAKELNGSELGPALRRAHVLALVKSGQFDAAFAAIKELGGDTEETDAVDLRLQVLREVTAAAEDVVFLEYVFAQNEQDILRIPTRPKLALANRLLDLGFTERAETTAASIPNRPHNNERQILLAEIALYAEQPQRALDALVEATGEEIDLLRAQAQMMAGAHGDAYALYRKAKKPDAAKSAAWLSKDLDRQALRDDPLFGPVLALAEGPMDVSTEGVGMLERSNVALTESETARQTLTDFLIAPQLAIGDGQDQP